jgi:hypothetical protein
MIADPTATGMSNGGKKFSKVGGKKFLKVGF